MKKSVLVLVASLFLIAGCRNADTRSTVASTSVSLSSDKGTSLGTGSSTTSSSQQTTSSETEKSEIVSSSDGVSSNTSIASSTMLFETVKLLPEHFPGSSQNYPAPGTITVSHHSFAYEDVMKNSANPQDKEGKTLKNVSIDVLQMKAETGCLSAAEDFPLKSLQVVILDTTNAYNLAYSQPRLYYASSLSSSASSAFIQGSFVPSFSPEGYKTITGTYVLSEPCLSFKLLADAASVENQSRAFKGLSITLNPVL